MGVPPPPDAPPPAVQDALALSAEFQLSPPITLLCGFTIPALSFSLSLVLPFGLPPFPPKFFFALGLNCDLENPLNVSAGVDFGGGRKATFDSDPDEGATI